MADVYYNTRVPSYKHVPLRTRFPQFDIHRELGPTLATFYSRKNADYLLAQAQRFGYGRTNPEELKPFMDLAARFRDGDSGLVPLSSSYTAADVHAAVDAMNRRTLDIIQKRLQVARFGMEQYYRDIQWHRFPDQGTSETCRSSRREPLLQPYYYGLE